MLLFADDTKVWRKVVDSRDEALLQKDLDGLSNWRLQCFVQFNIDTCKSMRIVHEVHPDYTLDGVKLKEVAEEKILELLCPTTCTSLSLKYYMDNLPITVLILSHYTWHR